MLFVYARRLFAQRLVMSASRRGSIPSPSISLGDSRFDAYTYNILLQFIIYITNDMVRNIINNTISRRRFRTDTNAGAPPVICFAPQRWRRVAGEKKNTPRQWCVVCVCVCGWNNVNNCRICVYKSLAMFVLRSEVISGVSANASRDQNTRRPRKANDRTRSKTTTTVRDTT